MDSIQNNSAGKIAYSLKTKNEKSEEKAVDPEKAVDATGMTDIQSLVDKLKDMDDVRPEAVQRGLEILNDPNYPDDSILDSVAETIITQTDG